MKLLAQSIQNLELELEKKHTTVFALLLSWPWTYDLETELWFRYSKAVSPYQ